MSGRHYAAAFKARMVQRMGMPGGPCAQDLARETKVPGSTLGRWLKAAAMVPDMGKGKRPRSDAAPSSSTKPGQDSHSTRAWTAVEKLRVVAVASQLKDEELGAFLRREGIHVAQLEEWRSEVLTALGSPAPRSKDPEAKRVRELERELARKDKALAEVTALLVLEKKVQALFATSAEEGDCTDEKYEKK